MTRPSYIPDDAEDITQYGATAGTDTIDAAEQNRDAIVEAANNSASNSVYLPAGNWYIGDRSSNDFLSFGRDAVDRGPVGTSLYGAGPEETFMTVASDSPGDVGLQIRYHGDQSDHGTVTWQGLTYDGNYEAIGIDPDQGNQRGLVIDSPGDFSFENVRIRQTYAAAIRLAVESGSYSVNRCTFRDAGIGRHNGTDGSSVDHFIAGWFANSTLSITNSVFELTSGTVVDFDGTGTKTTVENCWCRGIGSAMFKVNDTGSCQVSNLYFQGESTELSDMLNSSGPAQGEFHGRWFLYRLDGDTSNNPTFDLNDVEIQDLPYEAFYIRDRVSDGSSLAVTLQGGSSGPVAIQNSSTLGGRPSSFRDREDSALADIDIGQLSVHDTNGTVFDSPNANGTVGSLNRSGNDSLGDTGGISIQSDNQGSDPFTPTVPSRSEVGINPQIDGAPAVSWVAPTDSSIVENTVALQIDAADSEDDSGSLTVEYSVDGGAWSSASYNATSGYYESSWDSSNVSYGTHTLEARATDSAGNSVLSTISVVLEAPIYEDWSPRWDGVKDDWRVSSRTEYTGEHALAFEHSGDKRTRFGMSYDPIGEPSDVEVLDKFRVPAFTQDANLGFHARSILRASGSGDSENGYWVEVEAPENSFRLGKYTNGNLTTLKRFGTPVEGTFFYRRFRAEADQLKVKIWPASEDEPADWDVTVSDTDHASGWAGLGSFDAELVETDVFSVATGGASAELPEPNTAPAVSWAAPGDGATIDGSLVLQLSATDGEEDSGSLSVDYRIDGNSWSAATYNSSSGYHESLWDTTTVADGDHTLEARVTDSAGATATAQIAVTVDNETTSTSESPTIEQFDVTDKSNPQWTKCTVDWSVADGDGDLDMVVSTLRYQGNVVAAETTRVSGDTSGYTHSLRDRGDVDEIQLSVNDTENNTTTQSQSI